MRAITGRILTLAAVAAGLLVARRYYRDWGTTKGECRMRLPGDELVGEPFVQATEAVSINAPPSAIWPWLLQIGQNRGGLYGHEMLGNLLGLRFRNVDRVRPEWQRLAVGDEVRLAPAGCLGRADGVTFAVAEVVPEKHIVLRAERSGLSGDVVWSFHLLPHGDDCSRILIRGRSGLRHPGEVVVLELARPVVTLGIRAMLRGIKRRAEAALPGRSRPGSAPTGPAVELTSP